METTARDVLYDYQADTLKRMRSGCILCGGVGSGKSRTALAYYYNQAGGLVDTKIRRKMPSEPLDLYIITTARKRDTAEWELDMAPFALFTGENTPYKHQVTVDSWNNVQKYKDVTGAFFIFDEQRVVGYGAWSKAFIKIARSNKWILLSATPGDTWADYGPVFVANGFFKNMTEYKREHFIITNFSHYPKVEGYRSEGKLLRLRREILVDMEFYRKTTQHHEDIWTSFNRSNYREIQKNRWNIYKDEPIANASELCYALRKLVNSDEDRQYRLLELLEKHPKCIIFYNFDYELEILRTICGGSGYAVAEWNGHKHEKIPEKEEKWTYLVQYTSGAEGWNCTLTDTIIFYSQNYSYKALVQASGRIDRLTTRFKDLYYYHLKSRSGIDLAISKALKDKKKFNEKEFARF